jgi:hypothetical protein
MKGWGMKRLIALCFGMLALSAPAFAYETSIAEHGIRVSVVLDGGEQMTAHEPLSELVRQLGGSPVRYAYMEGSKSDQYSVLVQSSNPYRVNVCIAVDGRSALDGKYIENFTRRSGWGTCFVVAAYGEVRVKGWQINADAVDRFKFVADDRSVVVTHWGDSIRDIGTIAIGIFREDVPEIDGYRSMGPKTRGVDKGLGTGSGEREYAPVTGVAFRAMPTAEIAFVIRYDTWERLVARGVVRPRNGDFGRFDEECDPRFTGLGCGK